MCQKVSDKRHYSVDCCTHRWRYISVYYTNIFSPEGSFFFSIGSFSTDGWWKKERRNNINLAVREMYLRCYHTKCTSVCQHLFPESTFVARPCLLSCCRLSVVVSWSLCRATPRPSLSGTGVPWVSCLDPPMCHSVQDDPVAKSQPIVCVGWSRDVVCFCALVFVVMFRAHVQLRILTPLLDWKALFKLSVVTILRVVGAVSNSSPCSTRSSSRSGSRRNYIA